MAKEPHEHTDDLPKPAKPSRLGGLIHPLRASVIGMVRDPMRLLLLLAVNAALVGGVVGTAIIRHNYKPPPKPVTLDAALKALDAGKKAEARRMAEKLAANENLSTDDWGGPDLIVGELTAQASEELTDRPRVESFKLAALYLERAKDRGFPAGREAAGLYLLGKCLMEAGRIDSARVVLEKALPINADHKAEIRTLLIDAWLNVYPPELKKALAESERLLADDGLAALNRQQALVQHADILMRLDRPQECGAILDQVTDKGLLHGEAALLRGRILLAEGRALKASANRTKATDELVREKILAAVETIRNAKGPNPAIRNVARQAMYIGALCFLAIDEKATALAQMERILKDDPEVPEGLATLFLQAEVSRGMGRHAEAVKAYRHLLKSYGKIEEFHNPWINVPQMRAAVLGAINEYVAAEKYETAILLSQSLVPLIPKEAAFQKTAEIYKTWGERILTQAESLPTDRGEALRKQGRAELRQAGDAYRTVAQAAFTSRKYPDHLWNSAMAYFAGHDFKRTIEALQAYMHEDARGRHAQALVYLGESQLSLGATENALLSFTLCIEQHPRDLAVYRARLLASTAAVARGDLPQAEKFLLDNLNGEQLTPASKEWRESLFALGELLHAAGRYPEAIVRLDEALNRYPKAAQATDARYLLADGARRRALALRDGLGKEISSAIRAERAVEVHQLLIESLAAYESLQETLGRRDERDMTEREKALLRNARFAIGETYLDLERYPEALRAYQSAANHYAAGPEALDAYVRIANVYRRMDKPAEARTSLEQARLALRRIPANAPFEATTNYNRKQWGDLLDRLCSL